MLVCWGGWLLLSAGAGAVESTPSQVLRGPDEPAVAQAAASPIALSPLQIFSLAVNNVQRIAIGNPEIFDVTIVSPNELLLQAKAGGTTELLVWDADGQRQFVVSVMDPQSTAAADLLMELTELLQQLELNGVDVTLRGDRYFLSGVVDSEGQLAQIEQLVSTYGESVISLVTVRQAMPILPPPEPLVKLTVQVLELNRSELERIGVDWAGATSTTKSIGITETAFDALGTSSSMAARIGEAFRIGRLSREGFKQTVNFLLQRGKARLIAEPKLVTSSGKTAESFLGGRIPILTASSTSSTGTTTKRIEYREVGVKLKITPEVLPSGDLIRTSLRAEVIAKDTAEAIPVDGISVPGFKNREAETEITTAPGETIISAGLLQAEDSESVSQVPGIGSIPVFGRLFRSPEVSSSHTEIIITVTPELVIDEGKLADRTIVLEQALASAEVSASVEDPRLRYALMIQDRISKALRYPEREKELSIDGRVKLRLHLFADGTLGRVNVAESSGIEALDLEAVKAAETQSPYPAFPAQVMERELWLEVPVIFRPS